MAREGQENVGSDVRNPVSARIDAISAELDKVSPEFPPPMVRVFTCARENRERNATGEWFGSVMDEMGLTDAEKEEFNQGMKKLYFDLIAYKTKELELLDEVWRDPESVAEYARRSVAKYGSLGGMPKYMQERIEELRAIHPELFVDIPVPDVGERDHYQT